MSPTLLWLRIREQLHDSIAMGESIDDMTNSILKLYEEWQHESITTKPPGEFRRRTKVEDKHLV